MFPTAGIAARWGMVFVFPYFVLTHQQVTIVISPLIGSITLFSLMPHLQPPSLAACTSFNGMWLHSLPLLSVLTLLLEKPSGRPQQKRNHG